ncbi:MAG: hypothetical protein D6741_09665, partial [Planctomycetota bacterium]
MGHDNRPGRWAAPSIPIRFARCDPPTRFVDSPQPIYLMLPGPVPKTTDLLLLVGPEGICGVFEPLPARLFPEGVKAVGVLLPHVVRAIEEEPEGFFLVPMSSDDGPPDDPSQWDPEFARRLDSLAVHVKQGGEKTPDRFYSDDAVFTTCEPYGRLRIEAAWAPAMLTGDVAGYFTEKDGRLDLETTTVRETALGDAIALPVAEGTFVLIDDRGNELEFRADDIFVDSETSLESDYCFACSPIHPQSRVQEKLRLSVRVRVYPGGLARLDVVLHNQGRARHRGGLWDLGDPGSIVFRELVFRLRFKNRPQTIVVRETPSADARRFEPKDDFRWSLFQGGSGGPHPKHPTHVNRQGRVPVREEGYRTTLRIDGKETSTTGKRASPVAAVAWDEFALEFCAPRFWQTFPKALRISPDLLEYALFPAEWDDLHELQGGEKKTHTFWLRLRTTMQEEPTDTTLDWVVNPVRVVVPSAEPSAATVWDDLMGFA